MLYLYLYFTVVICVYCDRVTKRYVSCDRGTNFFKTLCMNHFNSNGGRMTVINKAALFIISFLQLY